MLHKTKTTQSVFRGIVIHNLLRIEHTLGPVTPTTLNFAMTKYPTLPIIFYFMTFEHPLAVDKLGLKEPNSGICRYREE